MLRSAIGKLMWAGKATVFMMGLALLLALILGVASAAFGANGQNFILGQNNAATALTKLTGNVNGSAMQVVNNNADANDSALSLRVQSGEAPMRVNSDTKVANLNSDQVDGFHAGCLSGQRLIRGLCYDENPQTAATLVFASDECSDRGGQLPGALQLRSIRDEPNIDLGSTTPHWSADLQHLGTANPPNDLAAVAVFDSGGILLRDDQDLLPYRCVYQPLTPE